MSGYGFTVGSSGYDDEDRLVNWERDDTNLDQSWGLSLVGDWSSITENLSTQSRTHGAAHELLTAASQSITHHIKGNMTSIPAVLRSGSNPLALSWDFDNRLTGADVDNDSVDDVTYGYDALGRRVKRDDGTNVTIFVQNGQQTFLDYAPGTAATSPTYCYIYASYVDEPIMRIGHTGGGEHYYHRNQQYSIVAITNGSGSIKERYAYTAYGELSIFDGGGTARSSSNYDIRHTYTGREWDEVAEIYHYRARVYDPLSGRFLGRDPIGYWDEFSLYASYVGLASTDPSGLKTDDDLTCPVDPKCGCPGKLNVDEYDLDTWDSTVEGPDAIVGVHFNLEFHPKDKKSCACDKIAFVQMVDVQPGPWRSRSHPPGVDRPFIEARKGVRSRIVRIGNLTTYCPLPRPRSTAPPLTQEAMTMAGG